MMKMMMIIIIIFIVVPKPSGNLGRSSMVVRNPFGAGIFFLVLAHPVCKM